MSVPAGLPGGPTDAGSLAETTLRLCQIPSVTGDEAALGDWLESTLRALPVDRGAVVRSSHSLVVRPPRRAGHPLVVLAGHTDTVPPRQDRPAHVQGDWLEGTGASDMKSALAVMLHLARDLDPASLPVDLGLVFYEREEGPFDQNYLATLLNEERFLHDPALVVCMEPTSNRVQVGCLGCIHATVTFHGKRAHSARPWQGENAVHKSAPFLSRLHGLAPRVVAQGPLVYQEVSSVTMVEATGTRNIVPDTFAMNLNTRFAPGKSLAEAQQDVLALVAGEADVVFTDLSPSGRLCLDNPLVQRLVARTGEPEPKQAWTDVARFSEIGVDAVNFGPGEPAQAHQRNEGVSVEAIAASYALTRSWLVDAP